MKKVIFSDIEPSFFSKTLHKRVNGYFKDKGISRTGNLGMYVKTTVMLLLYFVPYIMSMMNILPLFGMMIMYFLMGIGISGIGICIMHDSNHGAFSDKKWVNKLFSYSMNVMGLSSYNWKMQHNVFHHTFTNIYGLDEDVHDKTFLCLSPYGKIKKHHRFQHVYAPLLYCLSTINWFFVKDIKQIKVYKNNKMLPKEAIEMMLNFPITIITKLVYVFYVLALPIILGVNGWVVLAGFVIMHAVAGIIITTIFQLAHVTEGPEHHNADEQDMMGDTRAVHQLKTTANFAMKNKFVTWLLGGLNFQIEHHLFPNVCHVHYINISKIVKKTAQEFGLPYHHHSKFWRAVVLHFKTLKQIGHSQAI